MMFLRVYSLLPVLVLIFISLGIFADSSAEKTAADNVTLDVTANYTEDKNSSFAQGGHAVISTVSDFPSVVGEPPTEQETKIIQEREHCLANQFFMEDQSQCGNCTVCLPGTEPASQSNCGYGNGEKVLCNPCKEGHYQGKEDFKDIRCRRCRTCLLAEILVNCSAKQNAQCGQCLPGYHKFAENICILCERETDHPECAVTKQPRTSEPETSTPSLPLMPLPWLSSTPSLLSPPSSSLPPEPLIPSPSLPFTPSPVPPSSTSSLPPLNGSSTSLRKQREPKISGGPIWGIGLALVLTIICAGIIGGLISICIERKGFCKSANESSVFSVDYIPAQTHETGNPPPDELPSTLTQTPSQAEQPEGQSEKEKLLCPEDGSGASTAPGPSIYSVAGSLRTDGGVKRLDCRPYVVARGDTFQEPGSPDSAVVNFNFVNDNGSSSDISGYGDLKS